MRLFQDDKAESPIEVMATLLIWGAVVTMLYIIEGLFISNFEYQTSLLPFTLTTSIQNMMGNLFSLGDIFYALPPFLIGTLIVWGVKAILRKTTYTRPQDAYNDDF